MNKTITIVSPCFYENEAPAFKLIESCKKFGLLLSLYGMGREWKSWTNVKVVELLQHLDTIKTEFALYTDATDSWILRSEVAIMDIFERHHAKILISGERSLYPEIPDDYPPAPTSLRYICAGGFMGRVADIKQALTWLTEYEHNSNDQLLWHKLFLDKKMDIAIDYFATIFLPMNGITPEEINVGPPLQFMEGQTRPCVIHFNGPKGGSPNEVLMNEFWKATIL